MTFSNLDLLPQKQDSILTDRKNKIQLLLLAKKITALSIEALELFIQKKLSSFDAQVGENLCQIRAYKILLLGKKLLSNQVPHIEEDLENLKVLYERINPLVFQLEDFKNKKICYNDFLDKKETVISFLSKNELYLALSTDTMFLIFSYFLDIFCIRKDQIPIAMDYDGMPIFLGISKYLSRRITHDYQKKLSQLSSDFIMSLPDETPCLEDFRLVMPQLKQISDEDRSVLPCHSVTFTILHNMIYRELPLLIIVERKLKNSEEIDKIVFLFSGNKKKNNFSLANHGKNPSSPCMIIRGEVIYDGAKNIESSSSYAQRFFQTGIIEILLQNTAMHPQYSGKKLFSLRENPFFHLIKDGSKFIATATKKLEFQFSSHRSEALRIGCCKENPNLFSLKHIFCNMLNEELSKYKKYIYTTLNNKVNHNSFTMSD